ncbi:MAG TPA: hypothetical protein VF796_09105 [Humisphaera sp.]
MATGGPASFLLVDELFATGNDGFLAALMAFVDPEPLGRFAARWLDDRRPWARQQLLAYLDAPLRAYNHKPLIKRLFKGAEARGDDEVVAAFAAGFDRMVRRVRRRRGHWDPKLRSYVEEIRLASPRDTLTYLPESSYTNPRTLERVVYRQAEWRGKQLFTYHTRYYLRRRAWRYFRRMRHARPATYVPAVAGMLARYRDDDLAAAEHVLDSWSLVHACFGSHAAVSFTTHRARLAAGASVGGLPPSPASPELWADPAAARPVLGLVAAARSRVVRLWATDLLRRDHLPNLVGLPAADLVPLLLSDDEPVQALGAELLERAAGLSTLPFATWVQLLQAKSVPVLGTVAALARQHLRAEAVTLFEAVTLACSAAAPVALLGLHLLRQKPVATPAERRAVSHLADARSPAAAGEIVAYALGVLGAAGAYDVDFVLRFFDSLLAETRAAAWAWLTEATPGWDDATLWARLTESPHEDLRLRLVEALERRRTLPGTGPAQLAGLWTGVLLGIHRGGRRKLSALRQIADAVARHPDRAADLLPVLAVAIRSVRAPEARAGLAAVVSAVTARPELEPAVRRELPELELAST